MYIYTYMCVNKVDHKDMIQNIIYIYIYIYIYNKDPYVVCTSGLY